MSAPVCHIPGTRDIDQPSSNTQQTIPTATTDINSLVATVNALRRAVQQLQGQLNGLKSDANKRVQWKEKSRTVEKVKVYQNNDKTSQNWVEVEQINQLVMVDRNGQTWEWRRK